MTQEPTTEAEGVKTFTCGACGETKTESIPVLSEPTLDPFSATIELNDSLALKFIVDTSKLPADYAQGGYYLMLTRTYGDGKADETIRVDQSEWTLRPNSTVKYLMYVYGDLASYEMTDEFYVAVYNGEGKRVTVIREESIQAYAMRAVDKLQSAEASDVKKCRERTMFVDLLNYGAAAQQYFPRAVGSYNLDNLANSQLSDKQKAFATKIDSITLSNVQKKSSDNTYKTATVAMESKLELNMLFLKTNGNIKITQDMKAVITYTDFAGRTVEKTVLGSEFTTSTSSGVERWRITVNDLAIPDGDTVIRCTIVDANGNEVTWGEDTINSYLYRGINGSKDANEKNLYQMLRCLTYSAYVNFNSK